MADPLAGHEDRQLHVKGQDHLFERRRVLVPHEVVDEGLVLPHGLGALPVQDARRRHDALVAPHVIHEPDEALVQDRELLVQKRFSFGDHDVRHVTFLSYAASQPLQSS